MSAKIGFKRRPARSSVAKMIEVWRLIPLLELARVTDLDKTIEVVMGMVEGAHERRAPITVDTLSGFLQSLMQNKPLV